MEMIVTKSTFQDDKSGMDVCGLGLDEWLLKLFSNCCWVLGVFFGSDGFCEFLLSLKNLRQTIS